ARERLDLRLDAVAPREVVVRARLVELGSQGGEALAVLAPSALVERRARVAEVGAHREAAVRRDARRGSRLAPRLSRRTAVASSYRIIHAATSSERPGSRRMPPPSRGETSAGSARTVSASGGEGASEGVGGAARAAASAAGTAGEPDPIACRSLSSPVISSAYAVADARCSRSSA